MAAHCTAGLITSVLTGMWTTGAQAASIAAIAIELSSLSWVLSLWSIHMAAGGTTSNTIHNIAKKAKSHDILSETWQHSQALHTQCMCPTCRYYHWLFTECFFLSALLKALSAADTISLPQYTFSTQPATIWLPHQSFNYQRPCTVHRHCFDDKILFPECPLRDS